MFNKYNKEYIYPKHWDIDDINRFKNYHKLSNELYDLPDDLICLCIERQINEEKGLIKPLDHSKLVNLEITTPMYEEF